MHSHIAYIRHMHSTHSPETHTYRQRRAHTVLSAHKFERTLGSVSSIHTATPATKLWNRWWRRRRRSRRKRRKRKKKKKTENSNGASIHKQRIQQALGVGYSVMWKMTDMIALVCAWDACASIRAKIFFKCQWPKPTNSDQAACARSYVRTHGNEYKASYHTEADQIMYNDVDFLCGGGWGKRVTVAMGEWHVAYDNDREKMSPANHKTYCCCKRLLFYIFKLKLMEKQKETEQPPTNAMKRSNDTSSSAKKEEVVEEKNVEDENRRWHRNRVDCIDGALLSYCPTPSNRDIIVEQQRTARQHWTVCIPILCNHTLFPYTSLTRNCVCVCVCVCSRCVRHTIVQWRRDAI